VTKRIIQSPAKSGTRTPEEVAEAVKQVAAMRYQPVKISGCDVANNYYREGKKVWLVTSLIEKSKDLEVFDLPLRCFCIGFEIWSPITTAKVLAEHMKRVQETDMNFPVIMDDEGFIMDGWHRVTKALLEGRATIKAVRFDKTPSCDYVED